MIGDLFEVLSQPLRRQLLYDLQRAGPGATLAIPEDITAGKQDGERLVVELTHNHLPRLVEDELILWDREADEVARGPDFGDVAPLLVLFDNHAEELPYEWP